MGIYNCASTLEEALDSLLTQTYQGFKVIMCDDGSKDNTVNVAQSYVDKYPGKFILIKNESNQGLNKTLNNCLKLVDTEYVARMDGDDVCMPERLKTQIDFLDSHKDYAFVSTSMICFDNEGDFMTLTLKEGSPSKKNFVKSTPFFHATVLVRAEAYKNVGGYSVNEKLLRVEDYHLWFKMYAAGYRGYNLSAPYYKMRDDRNAIARRTWKNRRNEAYVKIVGYKMLHLPIYYYPYALVPIMKALLPTKLYTYLHRRR
jgi:glycosyltransferase EpsE